MTTEITFAWML